MTDPRPEAVTATSLRPVTPVGILARRLSGVLDTLGCLDPAHPEPGWLEDLRTEVGHLTRLASGLEPYLERHTSPASPALAALARRTETEDWTGQAGGGEGPDGHVPGLEAEMLSGHVEGQLLSFLVQMTGARRVLEIGMFTGYSALAMAEAVGDGGRVLACELDARAAAFAQESFTHSPAGGRIEVRVAPARDTLMDLAREHQSFELVFIDADKAGYLEYVQLVLDGDLLSAGGTICVDNTLMQGEPWLGASTENGRAITAFNDAIRADERLVQVMIPLRDGITLIRRV